LPERFKVLPKPLQQTFRTPAVASFPSLQQRNEIMGTSDQGVNTFTKIFHYAAAFPRYMQLPTPVETLFCGTIIRSVNGSNGDDLSCALTNGTAMRKETVSFWFVCFLTDQ